MLLLRSPSLLQVAFNDAMVPVLAQAGDFTVQKTVDTVMKNGREFGESNDSVRFGIILFALLGLLGYLAYLYISSERARIKDLCERLKVAEEKLDKEREQHLKDTDAHRAVMIAAITEFNQGRKDFDERLKEVLKVEHNICDDLARVLRQPVRIEIAPPSRGRRAPRELTAPNDQERRYEGEETDPS